MVTVREFSTFFGGNLSLSDLPVELVSEIFLKLPVRSLLTCQCVCKSFDELIRSPKFRASHVNHNSTSSTNTYCSLNILVIDEDSEKRREHILIDTAGDVISTSHVRQSNPLTTPISVIGSCNGLFCAFLHVPAEQWGSRIMLWNPVTRENRYLPKPNIDAPDSQSYPLIVFGFVPESNEYKVVRFNSYYTSGKILPLPDDVFVMQIEVYKMSTNSWTVLTSNAIPCNGPGHMSLENDSFLPLKFDPPSRTLFLKGAFHWLAVNPKNVWDSCAAVVAFDLKHEELKLISLLESHRILYAKEGQLEIINDLLGLIVPCSTYSPNFEIWAMNDYGKRESWTKQFHVELSTWFVRPCGYWQDSFLLMGEFEGGRQKSLFLFNIHTQERQYILKSGSFFFEYFCSCVETLVPVSKGMQLLECR
ncbi:hypothetical protein ACET3Z_019575 [Daucus carota]